MLMPPVLNFDASNGVLPPPVPKTKLPPPPLAPPNEPPAYGIAPNAPCPNPPDPVPLGEGDPELAEQAATMPSAVNPSPPQANLAWSRCVRVLDTIVYLWPPRKLSHRATAASNARRAMHQVSLEWLLANGPKFVTHGVDPSLHE